MDINLQAVLHIPKSNYAFAYSQSELRLRLRTAKGDCDTVEIVLGNKFRWAHSQTRGEMEKIATDRLFDYYQYNHHDTDPRLGYYFVLHKGARQVVYAEDGFADRFAEETAYRHFFQYPFINEGDVYKAPGWLRESVFYQIFVDRFYNGDPSNDPENTVAWGTCPPDTQQFYGGDLEGVRQKLPYIQGLGVNALYLTPIFSSPSNHKYNTEDYRRVDETFGSNALLKQLVDEAHARGIRVILDGVFNHSGLGFAPFQDVLEKGDASPYKDWFHIHSFPVRRFSHEEYHQWDKAPNPADVNYRMFGGSPAMPKLNTQNPDMRRYLYDTALFWMQEAGIDGWRLDVSDEIDHDFWRGFRKAVKGQNPDAVIIGENWHDPLPWLMGDQFDSVMNYSITKCCIEFFADGATDADGFAEGLSAVLMRCGDGPNENMLNLLDSHDTPRFLTQCGGDVRHLRLAAIFLFCFLGVPCTYYGTEVGLEGAGDPDCRRTILWDEANWNKGLQALYTQLALLRKTEAALQKGSIRLWAENGIFCLQRQWEDETLLCLLNNTEGALSVSLPWATDRAASLPALSAKIYKHTHSEPHGKEYPIGEETGR